MVIDIVFCFGNNKICVMFLKKFCVISMGPVRDMVKLLCFAPQGK